MLVAYFTFMKIRVSGLCRNSQRTAPLINMRNKSEGKHWASSTDSSSFSHSIALRTLLPPANLTDILCLFDVYGSVHRKNILTYIQQDATLHSLFYLENCSTCFGWYHHPLSKAQTTVSTASGICHTVTAICCYRCDKYQML